VKLGTFSKHLAARLHNLGMGSLLSPVYERAISTAKYWLFDRREYVIALYLGQGTATGEGVLGLSDIDLVAILAPTATAGQIEDLKKRYNRLSVLIPLFTRDELTVYTTTDLEEILSRRSPLHASLAQGQTAWKLIAGQNVLKRYRDVEEENKLAVRIEQVKLWIAHFYTDLFHIKKRDALSRRYLWFKALAEFLKFHGFVNGRDMPKRADALERFRDNHPAYAKHKGVWDSTIDMKDKTFASGSLPSFRERHSLSTRIVVNAFENLEKKLSSEQSKPMRFETDISPGDFEISKAALKVIKELSQTLNYWGANGIEICTRIFVGLDDIVLLINLPEDFAVDELRHVHEYLSSVSIPQNIFAYINHNRVVGTAVYPVDTDNSESAIVSRLTDPFVFGAGFDVQSFLDRDTAVKRAHGRLIVGFELWDPFASQWMEGVLYERDSVRKRISSREPLQYDVISFHRFFWKAVQIGIWLSRAETGHFPLRIPITGPQILNAAKVSNEHYCDFLDDFYECYKKSLNDEISDTIERYETALKILEHILARQNRLTGIK
jgi:hypothetical protein